MREMKDTITTVENYLSQDPLVKVTEKLGCGEFGRKITLNDLKKSPYVQIDDGILTIHESYTKNPLSYDLKNLGYEALGTAKYIAGHPQDVAHMTYEITKGVLTNPKAIAIGLLGLAIGTSGCIVTAGNTAVANGVPDLPIKTPVPSGSEIVQKITPDGLSFYEKAKLGDDGFRGSYDTDGDGDIDVKDSAVGPNDAAIDGNIANAIRYNFGIPQDSKLHQDYPNIEEFRVRQWDLDDDGNHDKIDILINGKIVHTTTTDTNQDGYISLNDALTELGWW